MQDTKNSYHYMNQLLQHKFSNRIEAGCDEAGRGCLAGPVVAAAVILPPNFNPSFLNDSKQLSEKQRKELRIIIENEALAYAVTFVDEREIESINILQASLQGMYRSALALAVKPEVLLIDGNKFIKQTDFEAHCVIKGDSIYQSIAAASVIAKTYRDEYMEQLSIAFPNYKWGVNKGYPTKAHRLAIHEHGTTIHHRQTFNLLGAGQLMLDL